MRKARIIVIRGEKGGCGKSTTAMHLVVSLLRRGFGVATIDLDARQGTLSRYIENRIEYNERKGIKLPIPHHRRFQGWLKEEDDEAIKAKFQALIDDFGSLNDFIVIDCPGNDTPISRFAHTFADTLVTPLNDSFLDMDVIARVDGETYEILRPSHYSEMLWEQRKLRAMKRQRPIDWIIIRNRLSHIDSNNKRKILGVLQKLSRRMGFRLISGFGERVIFRELFLKGLTLLDLREKSVDVTLTVSHIAARQEIKALLVGIGLGQEETADENSDHTNAKPVAQSA